MKNLKIIFLLLYTLFTFQSVSAYQNNIVVNINIKDQDVPVSWLWVSITIWSSLNKTFITNQSGVVTFWFLYDSEDPKNISILLNWNYVYLTNIESILKDININYDIEAQSIREVTSIWAKTNFLNQEIIQSTNYKLLLVYIFISLIIMTILLWWRYFYSSLFDKDIYKHFK